ncbi:MAG: hypothetical protein IT165_06625 [Bryobacterales bacterium]|nr:hypothetical protein [Bryobacterales bacterium]
MRERLSPAEAEALTVRLLDLLLDYGCFDEYWFHLNQRDLNAQSLLRYGRVHGGALRDFAAILAGMGLTE